MSGGHFDYIQHKVSECADSISEIIKDNEDGDESRNFSVQTLLLMREAEKTIRLASQMIQRVDWLLSGDDSEEAFHSRWIEELLFLKEFENERDKSYRESSFKL